MVTVVALGPLVYLVGSGGCVRGDGVGFSDLVFAEAGLTLDHFRGNEAALRAGLRSLEDGRLGNSFFAMLVQFTPFGFIVDIENLTQFPVWLNWERCALVDSDGWTHNILHPELREEMDGQAHVDVLIAPYAKRRIVLAPRGVLRNQLNRPGASRPFHPESREVGEDGFAERMILSLQYRDQELFYDLTLGFRPVPCRTESARDSALHREEARRAGRASKAGETCRGNRTATWRPTWHADATAGVARLRKTPPCPAGETGSR